MHEQRGNALGYTRGSRVTASVDKCTVLACNGGEKSLVKVESKWTEEKLPVVDQYTYLA